MCCSVLTAEDTLLGLFLVTVASISGWKTNLTPTDYNLGLTEEADSQQNQSDSSQEALL